MEVTFSMQSIHAQINNTSQTNSNSGNVQANNSQNSYFTMGGSMSSFIRTPASDFVVSGNWTLRVEGGNLSGFNANMTWFPTNVTAPNIQAHGHSFSNFIADPTNEKIVLLGPDNTLGAKQTYSINGVMDVGANQNQTKWPSVPANIKLGGKTITISLDDSKTDGHFNNYPVFGQIAKLEMNQVLSQSAPKQPGTQSQQTNQISEQKDNLKLDIILQFSNKVCYCI